jgi:hypothetical protein
VVPIEAPDAVTTVFRDVRSNSGTTSRRVVEKAPEVITLISSARAVATTSSVHAATRATVRAANAGR